MALPIVNAPRYSTTLPSTGKEIHYRPYNVKEEKILMIAMESKDQKQIIGAMNDVILGCVTNVDINKITTFDIEWLFLKLRSKSVGEKIDLKVTCTDDECDGKTDIVVDLDLIEVKGENKDNTIQITEEIGVTLRYPDLPTLEKYDGDKLNTVDGAFNLIIDCIESIYDEDNVYDCKNETPEDVKEFIDSLSSEQFQKIAVFFQEVPQVKHDVEWKCSSCGRDNKLELKGIESFFT